MRLPSRHLNAGLLLGSSWLLLAGLAAAEPPPDAKAFFEAQVRPVLEQHCYQCHSHAKNKSKGGLMADSLEALLKGGDRGPAIVPGKPDASPLIQAVRQVDDDLKMPPRGKLADAEIAALTRWVELGAPWPAAKGSSGIRPRGTITDEDRHYWAFQPVKAPALPEVDSPEWSRNPIDRFIYQRLRAEGLAPSPEAARVALVRRVYFDLIGLPPTPAEIDAFAADQAPDAYEKLVDRLLASPRYGERMARHWLDLVRYAESDGFKADDYRPHAWRYRDYVIRSLNDDKPYDRFITEQLAGDELEPDNPDVLVATGFLRLGIYEYNNRDARTQWANLLHDVTDVVGDAFLGMGLACARCHDHKYDPILQKDYFRLQAFFTPMMPRDDVPLATPAQRADHRRKWENWEKKTAEIRQQLEDLEGPVRRRVEKDAVEKFPEDVRAILTKPVAERSPLEKQIGALAFRQVEYEFERLDKQFKDAAKEKLQQLRKQLQAFEADRPAPLPAAMTCFDVGPEAPPTLIPKKGPEPVAPGFPTVLDPGPAAVTLLPGSTGRRTALAKWLTRPDNPLTPRVIVNRAWQWHFGRGLVATASDFGKLGEPPTHPELLDWLADRFVREGWSLKKLNRAIVTSRTYRQSSAERGARNAELPDLAGSGVPRSALRAPRLIDPENRLLWTMPTRRLDGEQIRDALLAATGQLDLVMGGPSVEWAQPRRTIYTKVLRNTRDPLLDVFDPPESFISVAQRNVTTTPTQALLLLNSPYLLQQARTFAARLKMEQAEPAAQVEAAYRLAFGRAPMTPERTAALAFLDKQAKLIQPEAQATAAVPFGKIPFHDGRAVLMQPGPAAPRLQVPAGPNLPAGDFTLEAYVLLRSVYEDGTVRPIAAHWGGDRKKPGWVVGVTGRKSAFKPQSLVLQLWGQNAAGQADYEAIFSGLHVELNKPYYVAVTVKLADPGKAGVTFHLKDLSHDDEPMQTAQAAHTVVKMEGERGPLYLGGGEPKRGPAWDGLLDDVRLSRAALPVEQLLVNRDGTTPQTAGYWMFEMQPGELKDVSGHGLDLVPVVKGPAGGAGAQTGALADLCQVLLNANEFLYVD